MAQDFPVPKLFVEKFRMWKDNHASYDQRPSHARFRKCTGAGKECGRSLSVGAFRRTAAESGHCKSLAADAKILLMDEPFGALDEITKRAMQNEMLSLQKQLHMTIVFITHDIREAMIL